VGSDAGTILHIQQAGKSAMGMKWSGICDQASAGRGKIDPAVVQNMGIRTASGFVGRWRKRCEPSGFARARIRTIRH